MWAYEFKNLLARPHEYHVIMLILARPGWGIAFLCSVTLPAGAIHEPSRPRRDILHLLYSTHPAFLFFIGVLLQRTDYRQVTDSPNIRIALQMSRFPRLVHLPLHTTASLPPHGCPKRNAANTLWQRIETLSFLVCLFLFSRAFIPPVGRGTTRNNQLLSSASSSIPILHESVQGGRLEGINNTTLMSVLEPYKDELSNRRYPTVINMTDLTSPPSRRIRYIRDSDTVGNQGEEGAVIRHDESARDSPSSENAMIQGLPAIKSRIARGSGLLLPFLGGVSGLRQVANTPSDESSLTHAVPPRSAKYSTGNEDPFFSIEEFDEDGEIFALKIWIDKKEHQQAKLGKVEFCQASSGIQCLSIEK
ncbi:hypothetical protein CPC08DRAFT_718639 [Agrocybe pediades]|nr:hypothetical protein CPC08DRAFT_718639 [Agrocybe pediades]